MRTHSTLSTPTPKAAMIFGRATLTIVASRTAMNVPIMTLASTHHWYDGCSWWSEENCRRARLRNRLSDEGMFYFVLIRISTDIPGRSTAGSGFPAVRSSIEILIGTL